MSFLDKAKKAAKDAGTEAQKQANIAKLNLELRGVRDEIKGKLTGMGELALKLIREDKLEKESFGVLVQEIDSLEGRVSEIEGKIADTKAGATEK